MSWTAFQRGFVVVWLVSFSVMVGFAIGDDYGRQTVPMAVIPRDSTVIIYRTIERTQPKPDTTLRYICKETP